MAGKFRAFVGRLAREHERRKEEITRDLIREWPPLLRSRATKAPPPPDSMIIARSTKPGSVELGWIDYPSGPESARRRWTVFRPLIADLVREITRRRYER
jgi:hypothetical protein